MATRTYLWDMIKKMTTGFDAARSRDAENCRQMMNGSYNYNMHARTIL